MAAFTWRGTATTQDVVNVGPLALMEPLLDELDLAAILDRHLPPDPQQEYSHGQVPRVLWAARLCQPTALVNVAAWAATSGADLFANLPADKLNDDRRGRALDAFFTQRHSILGSSTAQALHSTGLSLQRLHFDTTDLVLDGAYDSSQPRPDWPAAVPFTGDQLLPPAHLCHGYTADATMLQAGQLALVDERGAVPVLGHCLDGNRHGHPALRETFLLAQQHLPLPPDLLLLSDRGTCSVAPRARWHRHGYAALCAAPGQDDRALYDAHADRLDGQPASFLSREQHRRRASNSTLPREHYELAVLRHTLTDPTNHQAIPARLLFVSSSADEVASRQRRQPNSATIQAGLETLAAKRQRGHPQCTSASRTRQMVRLLGKKGAGRSFTWQLVPLTPQEQAAGPPPGPGPRRPSWRLEFRLDAAAAHADERYDGRAVLITTAPLTHSGDLRFTQYQQQNYGELLHHQGKTPLAVSPVFLKSPRRLEALVCLLPGALQASQVLERRSRQRVPAEEGPHAQRFTAERLLRRFPVYGLLGEQTGVGRVVHPPRLSNRQKQILSRLQFPTPAQSLERRLPPPPSG